MIPCECRLCSWRLYTASHAMAAMAVDMHLRDAHSLPSENLSAADAIIDTLLADDAETDLRWLNTLTLDDAAFLHAMQILPN